jgi:signal transduction histidine kinase
MQATQSRTASESIGQPVGFAVWNRGGDHGNGNRERRAAGGVAESAGLAHDAGNLLGALSLYSELLAMPGVLHDEHRGYAEELQLLSDRSRAMIGRLVRHARLSLALGPEGAVLPEMVERCRGVLSRVAKRRIDIVCRPGSEIPVAVPPEVMERILTNLVKNAAESMQGEGAVRVGIDCVPDGRRRQIVLTVEDTGCGMSEAAVRRLMQAGAPSSWGRHGLGFRVVRELAAMSGGCLEIESQVGAGMKVSIMWETASLRESATRTDRVRAEERRRAASGGEIACAERR